MSALRRLSVDGNFYCICIECFEKCIDNASHIEILSRCAHSVQFSKELLVEIQVNISHSLFLSQLHGIYLHAFFKDTGLYQLPGQVLRRNFRKADFLRQHPLHRIIPAVNGHRVSSLLLRLLIRLLCSGFILYFCALFRFRSRGAALQTGLLSAFSSCTRCQSQGQ